MTRRAVYTGSFDPITLGHLNVIQRASLVADELVVGVGLNAHKTPLFSSEERVELVQKVVDHAGFRHVTVKPFSGLAVRFVKECGARLIVRGVRSVTDMESEFTMILANRKLDPDIETVFFMAGDEYSHVSSTLIKQITVLASDDELARFVPREIIPALRSKLET
ncbi:pantetheine-phosphate adenylyltransferase [Botrimarina hoheduenensis]|uniref:Phosphopantetheine adenylyltransferase n=1 Tax=Botrimarina hoheduenensis TaxID=2528000 RepID=A0A5C5VTW5_9BACT|nr:pantetheine-phosphate adenylyltransferase [Botrimarina hoheduenensis]TWT41573.1 Phosphopantetheine adenylyltransferase [Botrimarina hoheduenensis]